MVNMKKYLLGGVLLCAGAFIVSCSSDEELTPSGEGTISLDIRTETGFLSRAVNEADYMDVNNYTVQVLNGEDVVAEFGKGETIPTSYKVAAGTYQVKAFYGEDKPASTESMYVEGVSEEVVLADKETKSVSVVCKPVCAKVTVNFSDEMDVYFEDYSVAFSTTALAGETFVWKSDATDPVYLKVGNEELVKATITAVKDGSPITVEKEYTMSPLDALNITVNPKVDEPEEGAANISIEIVTTTNDIEQDVTVPNDWTTAK